MFGTRAKRKSLVKDGKMLLKPTINDGVMQQKKIDELSNYKLKKLAEYLSEEIFGKLTKLWENASMLIYYIM